MADKQPKIDRNYEVLNAPSREELFDSLRLRGENRPVCFEYIYLSQPWEDKDASKEDERRQAYVKVYRITAPMGGADPNMWIAEGKSLKGNFEEDEDVMIIFSTQRRTGHITFNYNAARTPGEYDGIVGGAAPEGEDPEPGADEGDDNTTPRN